MELGRPDGRKDEIKVELNEDGSIRQHDRFRDMIEEVRTPERFPDPQKSQGRLGDFLEELQNLFETWGA